MSDVKGSKEVRRKIKEVVSYSLSSSLLAFTIFMRKWLVYALMMNLLSCKDSVAVSPGYSLYLALCCHDFQVATLGVWILATILPILVNPCFKSRTGILSHRKDVSVNLSTLAPITCTATGDWL